MSTEAKTHLTPSPKTAGTRRIILDLANFSLDLSWARGVSDSAAHNAAYPSPPMSGSPSHPARHKNDFDDRGYGGFGGSLHARQQIGAVSESQDVERDGMRDNAAGYGHNAQMVGGQYGMMYQQGGNVQVDQTQYHYQAQPQEVHQQRSLPSYQFSSTIQPLVPFGVERVSNNAPSDPAPAPKTQRKTKGHVESACVPCKYAHLKCDEMRPCPRCKTGGKEELCIDVQHKKRGRPRLRNDRENRLDSNLYTRGPELLRRPTYSGDARGILADPLMRNSYRVLKSQAGPSQPAARYLDRASASDANIYAPPPQPQMIPQTVPCAYLNMDFQIIKATQAFCESIGYPSVVARKLQDLAVMNDRDKIEHLKEDFEVQRARREPQYLPPLYGKDAEDRVIRSVGFGVEDVRRVPMGSHGVVTFQGMNGEHRSFELKVGLAKRDTTFFISLRLAPPPQDHASVQYSVSNFARDQQFGFQQPYQPAYSPQQFQQYQYQPPMQVQPSPQQHTYDDSQSSIYRPMMNTTTPIQQSMPLTTSMLNSDVSAYARPSSSAFMLMRSENSYAQPHYTPQAPRNDALVQEPPQMQQARPMTAQSEHVQLPPIRNQGSPSLSNNGMGSISAPTSTFRDGPSRLDIVGLLERPASQRRTSRG